MTHTVPITRAGDTHPIRVAGFVMIDRDTGLPVPTLAQGLTLSQLMGAVVAVAPNVSRGGGALIYVPSSLSGVYVDNIGTTPVTAISELIGLITDGVYFGELGTERVTNGNFSSGEAGWNTP